MRAFTIRPSSRQFRSFTVVTDGETPSAVYYGSRVWVVVDGRFKIVHITRYKMIGAVMGDEPVPTEAQPCRVVDGGDATIQFFGGRFVDMRTK